MIDNFDREWGHAFTAKMRIKVIAIMDAIETNAMLYYGNSLGAQVTAAFGKILDGTFEYIDNLIDEVDESSTAENIKKLVKFEMERLADEHLRPLLPLDQYYKELAGIMAGYEANKGYIA